MGTITKYATTLQAISDSRFQTNGWDNLENGVGDTRVATTSKYTKNFVPQQLYAHDFKIDVPEQYIIKNVRIEVRLKGSVQNTRVPTCYFYYDGNMGHKAVGYSDNIYSTQPNENISTSFRNVQYNMDWSRITQYKLTKSLLEGDLFGVFIQFDNSQFDGGVSIEYVRVIVDYEEPQYKLQIEGGLTPNDWEAKYTCKYNVTDYIWLTFKVHNTGSMTSSPKSVLIDIPLGVKIVEYETSSGAVFDSNTKQLSVDFNVTRSPYVRIRVNFRTTGLKKIGIIGDNKIGSLHQYLFVDKGWGIGADDDVVISSTDVRRWSESCFHFAVKTINSDGTAGFNIFLDTNTNKPNHLLGWTLDEKLSTSGVSINDYSNNFIEFSVPPNQECEIFFSGCFLPKTTGDNTLLCEAEDTGDVYTYDYTSLEPYTYIADVKWDNNKDIIFTNSRMVSTIDTGAYVYPMGVSEYDNPLVMDKSSLRLSKFNDIDYIGCVPLEQTHFNPKSTYKDTLLDTHYKNKRYMGKKGAIDETITLNVRLPPKDVTTIQGLISMDKPVPINANHKCFEGDSLNHRGWAELYSITSQKTNPHWYKCELGVKYITHNLNTRFTINKGSRVSDYFLPELMTDVCKYGDDLTNNFYIETNGGYNYSKSIEDYHLRNMLALPNGKRFNIKGMNRLSIKSQVNFNWYSTRNAENINNNLSRIVKLIDAETGNAVLEYEWYDINWSRSHEYTCRVICRILKKGAYKTVLNRNLVLNSDVEYDTVDPYALDVFGSELILKIVADKVTIQDCGFSGKELYIEDIDIQNGQYYFDVEFKNKNIDHDAPDITNWIDINIQELKLSSDYSNYYKNILVSPFPVPNKTIVFMRDSEEGTIFYLLDDGTECSYMVNPYYQYHCGVDLQSRDGISIFNLDNNYQTVYITNGLVKLGINRYNGRLTLFKYDKYSKTYVQTNQLQLLKYDDININSFTDDKIELQVSDTIITMWRGHPYIHFAHPNEDIVLNGKFTRIYADGVGNASSDIPQMYNLVDTTNLLPSCIASHRDIKSNCWELSEEDVTLPINEATISLSRNGGVSRTSIFFADCNEQYDNMKFYLNGTIVDGEEVYMTGASHKLEYQFKEAGDYIVKAIYWKGNDYYISDDLPITIVDNSYKITPTFPSRMYYLQSDYTCVLTYGGDPLANETVTFVVNGLSYHKSTNEEGIARLNNRLSPKAEDDEESQPEDYVDNVEPYNILMTYSENSTVLASASKDAYIMKGYANIDLFSSDYISDHTKPKLTVTKGGYVIAELTNNLDPNDDDIVEGERYIPFKSIVMTVNGRDYPRTTDEDGRARLNINLNKGVYDLRVSFGGDHQYQGTIKNFELRVVED